MALNFEDIPEISSKSMLALATEIKKEMSGGLMADDNTYSIPHIMSAIVHVWANLIRLEDEQNIQIGVMPPRNRYKSYPCLKVENYDNGGCKSCKSKRWVLKQVTLPKFMTLKNHIFMESIGIPESGMSFTPAESMFELNAQVGIDNNPMYVIIGDRAILAFPEYSAICEVTAIGIPDDPTETATHCYDIYAEDWDCPEYMKARIKDMIQQTLSRNLLGTAPNYDIVNNAQMNTGR